MPEIKAVIFDGKKNAIEKETEIEREVKKLKNKGIQPRLVSILVGGDEASNLFLALKKKAAERVGVEFRVKSLSSSTSLREIKKIINNLNIDESVHGIMVQLPLPKNLKQNAEQIVNSIAPEKDVDGMREDSPFLAPTVKAVATVIKEASSLLLKQKPSEVMVVGARGFVGKKVVKLLRELNYQVTECDIDTKNLAKETKKADILISATGVAKLINGMMVKQNSIVIDVGYPEGDVVFDGVVNKAALITPVPGGIGPLTISYLLENLVKAARSNLQ